MSCTSKEGVSSASICCGARPGFFYMAVLSVCIYICPGQIFCTLYICPGQIFYMAVLHTYVQNRFCLHGCTFCFDIHVSKKIAI